MNILVIDGQGGQFGGQMNMSVLINVVIAKLNDFI